MSDPWVGPTEHAGGRATVEAAGVPYRPLVELADLGLSND